MTLTDTQVAAVCDRYLGQEVLEGGAVMLRASIDKNHIHMKVDGGDGFERRMRFARRFMAERFVSVAGLNHLEVIL